MIAPGARRPQQETAKSGELDIGSGWIVGIQHALEIEHFTSQRILHPGHGCTAPLVEILPRIANPFFQGLRKDKTILFSLLEQRAG